MHNSRGVPYIFRMLKWRQTSASWHLKSPTARLFFSNVSSTLHQWNSVKFVSSPKLNINGPFVRRIELWLVSKINTWFWRSHYNDVIMGAIASQITSLTIVYSIVYSRRRPKKTSKLRVTGLCARNSPGTSKFPAQRVSNAENVSIWWRHKEK